MWATFAELVIPVSDDFPYDWCCKHLNSALNEEIQTQGGK